MPRNDLRLAGLLATLCGFQLSAPSPPVFVSVCWGLRPLALSFTHASVRGHLRFISSLRAYLFFACLRYRSTLELEGGTRHPGSQGLDALLRSVSCGVHHHF